MAVTAAQANVESDVSPLALKSAVARSDAARLRSEAAVLRWTTKVIVRESRRHRHSCHATYARACGLRAEPVYSPWSALLWQRFEAELDQVLVMVPARPS